VSVSAGERLCLIPARGGSKRLPRKNVLSFMGKPMLAWSIECGQSSGLFDRVYVSTEDAEIGAIAQHYGAVWARRPDHLAGDRASVADVCLDFLDSNNEGIANTRTLTVLYAAAPLRKAEDIRATVRLIEEGSADFAMTVTRMPFDPFEALLVDDDGNATIWQPEMLNTPRQKRPRLRIDAASVYAVRVEAFRRIKNFYGPNMKVTEISEERVVDIDTADDLMRAEFYGRWLKERGAA
jgi:pseudaminic acid cytidylyltransferase